MNFLIIDTTSKYSYTAIYYNDKVFYDYQTDLKFKHSETLLKSVDKLLKENNIKLDDMDLYCVCTGPGSFTGIRIGITTIRAFAQVFDKKVLDVNSLALKAYNINENDIIIPLINAVKDKYYVSAYLEGNEIIKPFMADIQKLNETKLQLEQEYGKKAFFVFECDIIGLSDVIKPALPFDYINYCKDKIDKELFCDYQNIVPVYAAVSQAEKEYEKKHKKMV